MTENKNTLFHIILAIVLLIGLSIGTYVLFARGVLPAAVFLSWSAKDSTSSDIAVVSPESSFVSEPAPESPLAGGSESEPAPTPTPVPESLPVPAPAPSPQLALPVPQQTALFKGSFTVETQSGRAYVSYEFLHPIPQVSAEFASGDRTLIGVFEGGRSHSIRLFLNSDARIASSAELWQILKVGRVCDSCASVSSTFAPVHGTDVATYANDTEEVIIYYASPVYVILHLIKPDTVIREHLQKFSVHVASA